MSDTKLVWSDELGDLRKKKDNQQDTEVNEALLTLEIRRLTSGKGRVILEIKGLPNNKSWNKKLVKSLKKGLGVGGAFKSDYIELHGENYEQLIALLSKMNLKFKKVGG